MIESKKIVDNENSNIVNKHLSPERLTTVQLIKNLNSQRRFSTPIMLHDKNGLSLVDRLKAKNSQSKRFSFLMSESNPKNSSVSICQVNDSTQINTTNMAKSNLNSNSNLDNSNFQSIQGSNIPLIQNLSIMNNKPSSFNPIQKLSYYQQPVTMNTMVLMNLLNDKEKKQPNNNITNKKKDKNNKKPKETIREGDWICSDCQNLNFSFRSNCNKCSCDRKNY